MDKKPNLNRKQKKKQDNFFVLLINQLFLKNQLSHNIKKFVAFVAAKLFSENIQ